MIIYHLIQIPHIRYSDSADTYKTIYTNEFYVFILSFLNKNSSGEKRGYGYIIQLYLNN